MAEKKKTRENKYNEILTTYHNTNIALCDVFAFKFVTEGKQHAFHYDLIRRKIKYYIYDGKDDRAIVIMPRSGAETNIIQALAAIYNGEEYTPNLKL